MNIWNAFKQTCYVISVLFALVIVQGALCEAQTGSEVVLQMTFDNDTANDLSDNNLHGTWTGTETYADGKMGRAAYLNGSSYITVEDDPRLAGMDELIISFWAKKDSSDGCGTFIAKNRQYEIYITTGYPTHIGNKVYDDAGNYDGAYVSSNNDAIADIGGPRWHKYVLWYKRETGLISVHP